ncbi:hypothetical protein ACFTWH_05980 [Streptomyces sp. NPDC057011]|uniref:hypothetical protein n=1 Tax=unclassified Streptomyces TaxID=2593676 RepID=UPI00362AB195
MEALLGAFGGKLAERWLSLLVLPGILFVGVVLAANTLGYDHALDVRFLGERVHGWPAPGARLRAGSLALLLGAVLLGAAAGGLAARAVGAGVARVVLAADWREWPPPARQIAAALTERRRQRWNGADARYLRERDLAVAAAVRRRATAAGPSPELPPDPARSALSAARQRRERICAARPDRPSWTGDRFHALAARLREQYALDLAAVWPVLWLSLPDGARAEVRSAHDALDRGFVLAGWGVLYAATAVVWWPGLPLGLAVLLAARHRTRAAATAYVLLLEATVVLHGPELARTLGVQPAAGPLDHDTGWRLTCIAQADPPVLRAAAPSLHEPAPGQPGPGPAAV